MKLLGDSRSRWWILAIAWLTIIVLGISGFVQQSSELGLDRSFLDNLYFTLQLMSLNYSGVSDDINWQLQIARFVAPVLAAGTLLQSASVAFRTEFTRWRARFRRGHTVVAGLGPAGIRIVRAMVDNGRNVVAVDPDPACAGAVAANELDVPVVVGDPREPEVLQAARVDRAARLVAVTADDAQNLAVATAAAHIDRAADRPPLRCAVHLADAELAHLLRGIELGNDLTMRLEFFNLHERAARVIIAEHPVTSNDGSPPHLVVMGLGQVGRNAVLAAAQQWSDVGEGPLRVTMVDLDAEGRWQALALQHPALVNAVDGRRIDIDLEAPGPHAAQRLTEVLTADPPTLVVVAFENQVLAWATALLVQRILGGGADVIVRIESDGGLGKLLGEALSVAHVSTGVAGASITTFPILERACTVEAVEGGVREQLARAIHEDHVARSGHGAALHRHWDDLADDDRESSRAAADAVVERVTNIGFGLEPLRHWNVDGHPFTPDEVEALAAAEHGRWKVEREAAGWTWGVTRDDDARHNPLLVDWDRLDETARSHNRAAVTALPALLARAGLELSRS